MSLLSGVADLSIVQSVRRSLNTTATTVLPVFTLYLLGSPTIKDFMVRFTGRLFGR